jgi:hypothetical protein
MVVSMSAFFPCVFLPQEIKKNNNRKTIKARIDFITDVVRGKTTLILKEGFTLKPRV